MQKIGTTLWVADASSSTVANRLVAKGELRRLQRGLFTSDMKTAAETICVREAWKLVQHYVPGAMIADRTAIECRPGTDGSVFLVHDNEREIEFPGLRIVVRRGVILESDVSFMTGLRMSSTARMLLDNLRPSRSRKGISRTVGKTAVEEWLEKMLHMNPESTQLTSIRNEARSICQSLGLEKEYHELNAIIGAFRGTAPVSVTSGGSKAVSARIGGEPFDSARIEMFRQLVEYLNAQPPFHILDTAVSDAAWLNVSFFDAYFSNFIEGTEFGVDEAMNIIYNGFIPDLQKADAHDVLGTYDVCSDPTEMMPADKGWSVFKKRLQTRHMSIMQAREEKCPGQWKHIPNHIGGHLFVSPPEVEGTLKEVYGMLQEVRTGFGKAVFLHAALAETHPFLDGNGRISRISMNAELVGRGLSRIIIPSVFRNNYIEALSAFTSGNGIDPIYEVMQYIQQWTAMIPWDDFAAARTVMEQVNAFRRPEQSVRLRKPTADEIHLALYSAKPKM